MSTLQYDLEVISAAKGAAIDDARVASRGTRLLSFAVYRAISTFAYLASRYVNLVWLILAVVETDAQLMLVQEDGAKCYHRTLASLLLFGVGLCSSESC